MKFLLSILTIAAMVGVVMLKGYNAMGCAYIACMALFCLMCLSIRVKSWWSNGKGGRAVLDVNPEDEIAIHEEGK